MRKLVFLFIIIIPTFIFAQEQGFSAYDLFRMESVSEAQISPDANYIAFTLSTPKEFDDKPGSNYRELHLLNLKDKSIKKLIEGEVSISSISWSPDSKKIFFLEKMKEDKHTRVYSIGIDSDDPDPVSDWSSSILQYQQNPDGKSLAFVSKEELEDITPLDSLGFNQEIVEENVAQRLLYLQDLESGEVKKLTNDKSVFDFEWHPSGKKLAAAIAPENLVDASYMLKRIYTVDAESGETKKLVENPGKLGNMAWSPDGKHLAFVSAASINDAVTGSLFIVEENNQKDFEELKKYSEGFEGSVTDVHWKDNKTVLFAAEESVDAVLSEQKIGSDERKILLEGGKVVFDAISLSNNMATFVGDTKDHPNEVYTFNLISEKLTRQTFHNEWLENVELAKQEKISYKAKDGLRIDGVLIYPLNYEENKKYPLIAYVHGGPESAMLNGWQTAYSRWGQIAAAKGYFVFMPNYRASAGRGVDFTMMGFGDLAGKEFDDVIDGIDYLIDRGMVDGDKVGIGGGSYGGYFSAWGATKHSDRFAAAVSFVGVSNQISKRNTTDIPWEDYYVHWGIWTNENLDLVYDRSPVKYADQSRTPTLILAGKADPRVHPSQSLELFRSLKMFGKAPVRLVFYPGEGHGNRKNPARLDYSLRTMRWFDYYLKSDKPQDEKPPLMIDYDLNLLEDYTR